MDFVEHDLSNMLAIQSYCTDFFEIAGKKYVYPIILGNEVIKLPEKTMADLTLSSFQPALDAHASLIIIGTGISQQFLEPKIQVQLAQLGIGVECMNTAAACRTLTMIQGEGRQVWAWLWL